MTDPLVLFRAIHLAATALACGTVAFLVMVAEPVLARSDGAALAGLTGLRRRYKLTIWIALAAAAVSEAAWLIWLSADIYGTPIVAVCLHGGLWTVLTDTRFGLVCTLRFALAAVLALLVAWPAARLLQLAAAAGLIVPVALIGHAGATPGSAGDIHLASDMVHLLAAAGWLGALPTLAMLLAEARRENEPAWRAYAVMATQQYSRLGVVCVAALLVTGIVNSWILLSGPRELLTTDYGRLLLLKIGLFVAMLAIASANRFHLSPQLPAAGALRALQWSTYAETGLGLGVLLFVGVLGTLSPGDHAHRITAEVPADAAFVHIHTSLAMAEVTIEPGRIGAAHARIRVLREDLSEYPARSVEIALDPPGAGTTITRTAAHLPDGTWQVNGLDLPRSGTWTVRVIVPGDNGTPILLDSPIVIEP